MRERTVLFLLCVFLAIRAVTLPIHPITDDTEARYATVARDMADSGDWITPRVWVHGEHVPFLGKPPLHIWATSLSIRLFGANEFAVRFPSLVGAFLIVTLMWVILRRYVDVDITHSAVVMVSSCVLFFVLAGAVVIDMTLALCVTGSVLSYQAFLMETVRARKRLWSLGVFISLGLGFLTKGPVAVVMFGIPVFLWTLLHKRWGTLKDHVWWAGILVFLGLTVPWFWLAEIRSPGFLKYFFYNENLLRFVTHEYGDLYGRGHQLPYGTAIAMLLLAGLPWTLWCIVLLFKKKGREWLISSLKNEPTSLFTLSLMGITLFLCLARQLLLTYLLPVLPFFAVWGAILLRKLGVSRRAIFRASFVVIFFYGIAYPLVQPWAEQRYSAKGIVRLAREARARFSLDGGLMFASRVPYSAYFYGRDFILPHDGEDASLSISRGLNSRKEHLYVINRKYQRDVPPQLLGKLETVCIFGNWTLYRAAQKPLTGN
jgi:4-amino-4-deoxy-L-arabinose transferase-like glycosyltransferase